MRERDQNRSQLEFESGLRWYTVQTKPRKERGVEQRLRDLDLEVFLPWMRTRRRIGSRFHWVLIPLFPGYLFCCLDMSFSGKVVRYAPGVRDFVKFGNQVADVGEEVIRRLKEGCPDGIVQIKPRPYYRGELVKIREGPMSGLEAVFEREMKGSDRVAILMELLGRQTRLIISTEKIARV